jgi:hypothetical protein
MFEAPSVIGTCINCIAPGSLSATLALIMIGVGFALTAERRKATVIGPNEGPPEGGLYSKLSNPKVVALSSRRNEYS